MNKQGKILGVDFGERRIGLALSDSMHTLAKGFTTIDTRKFPDFIGRLLYLAKENKVTKIVVGYPLRTDGLHSEKAEVVNLFIQMIEKRITQLTPDIKELEGLKVQLPIERENEAYSSVRAQQHLQSTNNKKNGKRRWDPQRNKNKVDQQAAACILQDYLNGRGSPL